MKYGLRLHPDVVKYLNKLGVTEKNRVIKSIKLLSVDPYRRRSGCDIQKLSGWLMRSGEVEVTGKLTQQNEKQDHKTKNNNKLSADPFLSFPFSRKENPYSIKRGKKTLCIHPLWTTL